MEEVDSRLVDQRWRMLLHQPKMTSVVRRIVRYQPTGDALFPAASRMVRRRPVDMSARNQKLRCASIRTTCMWCADTPAANGVTAEQPWHDLVVAGQGRTMLQHGVLAATVLVWSLINRQAESDTLVIQCIIHCVSKKGYYQTPTIISKIVVRFRNYHWWLGGILFWDKVVYVHASQKLTYCQLNLPHEPINKLETVSIAEPLQTGSMRP